ncbi:MAG TPA: allantoinase AllB, partial [Thermoanaerobaculia bacterium]|nr:allantoinase AllB [Thermoanaerobaculia bacterium]
MPVIRGMRVFTPDGTRAASIHIRDGRIARVADYDDVEGQVMDYGGLAILPGIVDSHVHVNEPGRTEWEGFETATRAAAAGGVTTIVDMPLNCIPPTTSVDALLVKAEAMSGKCRVDVGLWGGAVPGNAKHLGDMLRHGALGFKCFLVDSGIAEFGHLDAGGLALALDALRETNAPLLVHAELAEGLRAFEGDSRSYRGYLASRPKRAEDLAIELVAKKCEGSRAHIVHLSSASALDIVRRARDVRLALTAETTPHYLYFEAEAIPDAAPEFKCAPPIREHENREQLWRAVDDELLAAIVSDHSPCTPELKKLASGDVEHAWGGITSMQFALPIVWTEARRRGIPLARISRLMSEGPARLAGLDQRKGKIAAGFDADLAVIAPEESFIVDAPMIEHRHKVTP